MTLFTSARKAALAFLLLAWPATAQANIGDTVSELRARYGSAKDMGSQLLFEVQIVKDQIVRLPPSADPREGYSVTVYFDGEHSAMEVFTPNTSDPAKSNISQQDIDQILASESDGLTWNPMQSHTGKPTWLRIDNKIIARLSEDTSGKTDGASVLIIMLNGK